MSGLFRQLSLGQAGTRRTAAALFPPRHGGILLPIRHVYTNRHITLRYTYTLNLHKALPGSRTHKNYKQQR